MFWIACIQPAPLQQTKPAPASSVHKQTAAQESAHWAWSNATSKSSVLTCSVPHPYRQWHIHVWLPLPLLHTPCVCFERPVVATAGRASALEHLLLHCLCFVTSSAWYCVSQLQALAETALAFLQSPRVAPADCGWGATCLILAPQKWANLLLQTVHDWIWLLLFVKPFCCGCSLKNY